MKHFVILTSLFALLGCKGNAQKLQVTAIYTEPKRITKEIPETGKIHTYTTRKAVTERLNPMILMLSKNAEALQFRIQGNISSGGHTIHQVNKIRFEIGEQSGNTITLKYYVEIKKKPGKESANIQGYNYTQDEIYKIPGDIKIIRIELYEDQINDPSDTKSKLVAQQTFNFFAKI
ncbi:MAG: hypothetical protein ACN6OB_05240 [Chryseobacterium jejuense]|uniref:hypothetical protein n=1 Tax=Chryseobacterium jejuense TaxID=445960 RepID=UPI003D09E093